MVVGGVDQSGTNLASAELYDPSSGTNGMFTAAGSMTMTRYGHEVAVLRTGEVLIVGGYSSSSAILSAAEVYNPTTGKFTATRPMNASRVNGAVAALPNGMILVAGGRTSSADLYCSQ